MKALEILFNETEDANAKGVIERWFTDTLPQTQKLMVQDNSTIVIQSSETNTCVVAAPDLLDVHLGGAHNTTDCE